MKFTLAENRCRRRGNEFRRSNGMKSLRRCSRWRGNRATAKRCRWRQSGGNFRASPRRVMISQEFHFEAG